MKARTPPDSPRLFDDLPNGPDFSLEEALRRKGVWPVAGTDEAGRGPLAGPVVAAAVILDRDHIPDGLNDSKKLSAKQRDALYEEILKVATVSIASSSPRRIDATDIRKASLDAMQRAVAGLALPAGQSVGHVLTDGRDVPPALPCRGTAVIKGDARSVSIAAASIIAKVIRDRMMERTAALYPSYGFELHAGYGTAMHRAAIAIEGPCPLHRMSFRPLRPN
ncbi:ribonuclease HII [Peteryoungia desertarenae]|uniref:Ribonuclease HII n=1 Tax=Peteryoungia desertarenae TaxID=1813451 RepID=A0ABX6QLR5_9HYPH|nr:ribonuclease HII [Peteryoungia desertarenae]QLF69548.1 ribonuclease HII [Peteryoungia desertarenae]